MKKKMTIILEDCKSCRYRYIHGHCGSSRNHGKSICTHPKAMRKDEEGTPKYRIMNYEVDQRGKAFPDWCPLKDA